MMNCKRHPARLLPALLGLVLLLAFAAACKPRQPRPDPAMPTLSYTDALGSTYTLRPDSLTYDPIKPQFSSSGMADGGDPAACALTAADYQGLKASFDAAIAATDQHIQTRLKGCGSIRVMSGEQPQDYFIAMNAPVKAALEASLKSALHRP
jgi:hypothetical protein